jgi:hypothetical protein
VADPHTLHLDGPTRPWRDVPEVVRCGACFGALPPDTTAACKYCGEGTPPGLTVLQPLVAPAVLDEEHVTTPEQLASLPDIPTRPGERWLIKPEPPAPRPTWWERFARWPHA